MTSSLDPRAWIDGAKSLRRAAAVVTLVAIACTTASEASAQLDSVLRNLFQNAIPTAPPVTPNYQPSYPPPSYSGYPPQPAMPPNPGYNAYPSPQQAPPAVSDAGRVSDLQRMLSELGYDAGPADGQPGSRTVQAIRAFQRDHGQPATGEVTDATILAVRSVWYERNRSGGPMTAAADRSPSRPGFDCARAANPTERQICASPQLARLDAALSQAFGDAMGEKSFAEQAKQMAEQQRWLQQRNACGADATCIERSMTQRLAELGSPQRAVEIAIPTAAAASSGVQSALQVTSVAGSGHSPGVSVDDLMHPPASLRPLGLRIWDRLPLLHHPDSPDTDAFLDLVTLGIRPDLLETSDSLLDQAADYSRTFLIRTDPLNAQNWSMRNEFEKKEARAAFLRQYAEPLRRLAPRPPFRFAYATAASLGRYDAKRRGFDLNGMGSYALQRVDPLQPGGIQLAQGRIGVVPRYDFDMPSAFWPIDEADARVLVARLFGPNDRGERRVQVITVFDATDAEPQTVRLGLQIDRLEIWDDGLTTRLYSFDVAPLRHQKLSSASPLQRLLNPPAVLRPWPLISFEGRPAIAADQVWQVFEPWIPAQDLLRLAAAGTIPGYLEDRNNLPSLKHLFSDQVIREVFLAGASVDNPGGWAGSNEFARDRTRQTFYSRYAPALREVAPRPPFDFVYLQDAMLDLYAVERRAFPIEQRDADFQQRVREAGLIPAPTFSLSGLSWPIDPGAAEAVVKTLPPNREVKTAATYEIASLDPATKRLVIRLKALSLYAPDLKRKLYDFPIKNDPGPYLTAGPPERLRVAEPVVLDDMLLCLKFIEAGGESVAPNIANTCWDSVAKRDEAFYAGPDASANLAPDDARRPLFPRGGADRTAAAMAIFVKWAKAYAGGLPATAMAPPSTGTSRQPDGSERVQVLAEARTPQTEQYAKFLRENQLQQDQLVSPPNLYGDGENMPVLYILPNRRSLYSVPVGKEALARHPGTNAQSVSTFRVGAARIFRDESGRNALAIDLTPLSIRTFIGNDTLASRTFDDIPRLDGQAFTAPAPQPTASATASSLPLDAALVDLVATKAVGEKLSQQARIYLVLRRWRYENGEGSTPGGRFFVVGKRQPTPDEAAALGPKFVEWVHQHGPDLPVRVTLRAKIDVATGKTTAPWRALPCLGMIYYQGGAYYEGFRRVSVPDLHDLSSRKSSAEKGTGSWSEQDEQKLLAADALAGAIQASFVGGITGPCWMAPKYLDFPDPLGFVLRIPHALPTPDISAPTGKQQLDVTAALEITSLTLSQTPPSLVELLPEELAKAVPQSTQQPLRGEFVAVDMSFVEAHYRDAAGREIERLGPDRGDSIESVVRWFEQKRAKLLAAEATPNGPYGPDLIGVQLGMSFEDAERAIRKHMKVGRVLEGRRAFDEAEKSGLIKPMDSGKLFISEGEDELIAIIDEPPAAAGRLLAAWRRVSLPAGSVDPTEIFAGIRNKYGAPGPGGWGSDLRPGIIFSWHGLNGTSCAQMYIDGTKRPLDETWFEEGRPTSFHSANTKKPNAPFLVRALFDPLADPSQQAAQCGPYLTTTLLEARHAGGQMDELDMTLTDIGPYRKAYAESRAKLQQISGSAQRPTGGIKF